MFAQIRGLLEEHGYGADAIIDIPFDWEAYAKVEFNFKDFPSPDYFETVAFSSLASETKNMAIDHLYHDKNIYAINNNGARNAALHDGKKTGARWILPFDGNCYITQDVYDKLNRGFTEYVAVHSEAGFMLCFFFTGFSFIFFSGIRQAMSSSFSCTWRGF